MINRPLQVVLAIVATVLWNIVAVALHLPSWLRPWHLASSLAQSLVDLWGWIGEMLGRLYVILGRLCDELLAQLGPAVRETFGNVWDVVSSPLRMVAEFFKSLGRTVVEYTVELWDAAAPHVVSPVFLFVTSVMATVALVFYLVARRLNQVAPSDPAQPPPAQPPVAVPVRFTRGTTR